MTTSGQYLNQTEKQHKKRVWYTGTDALKVGYTICYDRDYGTAATAEMGRAWQVEKPKSDNLKWFAGFVSKIPAKTGEAGMIEIVEALGKTIGPVWTDASCTVAATDLYLVSGSYAASNYGGKLIAKAMQTVDRSTTNGTVLAEIVQPGTLLDNSARSRTTVQLPTAAIWDNFPLDELRRNPFAGSLFETDFTRPYGAMFTGQTAVASGDIYVDAATDMVRTKPGLAADVGLGVGALIMTAGAAHSQVAWRPPCPITTCGAAGVAGKRWAFEARIAVGSITDGDIAGIAVGLIDAGYLMAGAELVNTSGAVIDKGFVGFNSLASAEASLLRSYKNEGQAVQVTAVVKTMVADTFFTVGMYYNGTTIACYVDGVVNTTGLITNAMIIEATPLFPQNEALNPIIVIKETAVEANTLTVDWVRAAQMVV